MRSIWQRYDALLGNRGDTGKLVQVPLTHVPLLLVSAVKCLANHRHPAYSNLNTSRQYPCFSHKSLILDFIFIFALSYLLSATGRSYVPGYITSVVIDETTYFLNVSS